MRSKLSFYCQISLSCLLGLGSSTLFAQDVSFSLPPPEEEVVQDFVVEDTQENRQIRANIAELQARIEAEEATQDAFSNGLGELSYDLGNQLLQLNLFNDALAAFRRAEHLLRINHGLYSLEQVPALEGMIQANMRLQDWEKVDEDMDRLIWLYSRNRTAGSPEYLSVLSDYAKYHLAAFFWNVDEIGLVHLIEAQDTLQYIADVSLERGFEYDPLLYESMSITNYTLMGYASSSDRYMNTPELDRRMGLGSYLANSYRRGLDYLRAGREVAYQSNNLEHRIHADLILADWYQLFFKRYEAQEYLKQAWETARLAELEDSPEFVQPHILPRQGYLSLLPDLTTVSSEEERQIAVRMDIDEWGAPRNVEIAGTEPTELSDEALLAGNRAIRAARQSRFRPAIVDGEPVEYVGYVHAIVVKD